MILMCVVRLMREDEIGRKITFQLFEDGQPQKISIFSKESELPLSIVLDIDTSLSTRKDLPLEVNSARRFAHAILRPVDALSVYAFNESVLQAIPFTSDLRMIDRGIEHLPLGSATALFDAVYLGMEKLKKAEYPKRALIVITDGDENHSRYNFTNLQDFVKEQNVQIFTIGAEGAINLIVQQTGGYAFHGAGLADICEKIAVELKNEYVIGYRSTNQAKDGRWRKVQLKVDTPRGMQSKLSVRAKTGYYAAAQ